MEENIALDEQHEIDLGASLNIEFVMDLPKKKKSLIETLVSLLIKKFEAFIGPMEKVYAMVDGYSDAENCKRNLDELEKKKLNNRHFKPEMSLLFNEIDSSGLAIANGYNEETFNILVTHMIIAELHLYGESNSAVLSFDLQEHQINEMLKSGSKEETGQFWNFRQSFIELYKDKDWIELELARIVLDLRIADQKYIKEFGELLIENTKLTYQLHELSHKIDLKTENPKLSMAELELELANLLSFQKNKEGQLNNKCRRYGEALMGGIGMATAQESEEEVERKRRETVHKLTLDLKSLIHDDHIVHHPNFNKLSEEDRMFLDELLKQLPSANEKNGDSKEPFHGYDLYSPNDLRLMVYRAKAILENAGIEMVRTETLILGETLQEKLEFLNLEILRLKKLLPFLRAQFSAHTQHIRKIEKALSDPETEKESLQNKIQSTRENIVIFEKELQLLFEEEPEQDN